MAPSKQWRWVVQGWQWANNSLQNTYTRTTIRHTHRAMTSDIVKISSPNDLYCVSSGTLNLTLLLTLLVQYQYPVLLTTLPVLVYRAFCLTGLQTVLKAATFSCSMRGWVVHLVWGLDSLPVPPLPAMTSDTTSPLPVPSTANNTTSTSL